MEMEAESWRLTELSRGEKAEKQKADFERWDVNPKKRFQRGGRERLLACWNNCKSPHLEAEDASSSFSSVTY